MLVHLLRVPKKFPRLSNPITKFLTNPNPCVYVTTIFQGICVHVTMQISKHFPRVLEFPRLFNLCVYITTIFLRNLCLCQRHPSLANDWLKKGDEQIFLPNFFMFVSLFSANHIFARRLRAEVTKHFQIPFYFYSLT